MTRTDPPFEVIAIRNEIQNFFRTKAPNDRDIGSAKVGVYAFFDYDNEPIYVGQTVEELRTRVGRHLTGRRSDSVAKFVLDPFEVLWIEVWPLFEAEELSKVEKKAQVNSLEYAVYQKALAESQFEAVLNEGIIPPALPIEMPQSYRGQIIPEAVRYERDHPDIRIARRATTIASLARNISERKVDKGLRKTLLVQAQRLESLARARFEDFADEPDQIDTEG